MSVSRRNAGANRDRPLDRLPIGGAPLRVKMAREGVIGAPGADGPGSVPDGGTDGQVLTKQSSADYDVAWEAPSGGGGNGWFPGGFA